MTDGGIDDSPEGKDETGIARAPAVVSAVCRHGYSTDQHVLPHLKSRCLQCLMASRCYYSPHYFSRRLQ